MSEATKWLDEEIAAKSASSFNNGCATCGIEANGLQICLDEIERLRAALKTIISAEVYNDEWVVGIAKEALGEDECRLGRAAGDTGP
jgi:hypothetical protein